jgi:undecaprenyl-diphosphatase
MSHRWRLFLGWTALGLMLTSIAVLVLAALKDTHIYWLFRRSDPDLMDAVRTFHGAWLTAFMVGLSKFGSWKVLPIATGLICGALIAKKRWRDALGAGVAVGLASIINPWFKTWFRKPRPELDWTLADESFYSFPSGHAFTSVVFWGMVTYLVWHVVKGRTLRTALVAVTAFFALMTGISRVYLGVHFPSDVLAGWTVGVIWLVCMIFATRALHRPGDPADHDEA